MYGGAGVGLVRKQETKMKRASRLFACAVAFGAEVRANNKCLTREIIARDPRYRDLIRAHGWSRVWGAAVQGWADENRRRSADKQEQTNA